MLLLNKGEKITLLRVIVNALFGVIIGFMACLIANFFEDNEKIEELKFYIKYYFDIYIFSVFTRMIVLMLAFGMVLFSMAYCILIKMEQERLKMMPIPKTKSGKFLTEDEYKRQMKETTTRELIKLVNNREFMEMASHKALVKDDWNWQTRERKGKEFKEFMEDLTSSSEGE